MCCCDIATLRLTKKVMTSRMQFESMRKVVWKIRESEVDLHISFQRQKGRKEKDMASVILAVMWGGGVNKPD